MVQRTTRGARLVLLLLLVSLGGGDAWALTLSGVSDRVYENLVIDGQRNSLVVENSRNLTFRNCKFTNSGSGNVWFINCDGITLEDSVISGAGSIANHTDDCVTFHSSRNLRLLNNEISRGGHGGVLILRSGGEILIRDNRFSAMGGSLLTIKEEQAGMRAIVEGNRMTGAPDRDQSSRVHPVDHAALQWSGQSLVFRNNLVYNCGRGLLISSGGPQVAKNAIFENNTLRDFRLTAIELQGAGGAGTITNNVFRNNRIANAPQLLHAALPGAGRDLWGNRFENNGWFGGAIYTLFGSPLTPEAGNSLFSTWTGNYTLPSAPVLEVPPTSIPSPDPEPAPNGDPALTRLTPSSGLGGRMVTFTGKNFFGAAYAIWSAPVGLFRTFATRTSETTATAAVPLSAVTGPVYLRFVATDRSERQERTEAMVFTVGVSPPPPPPVANVPKLFGANPGEGGPGTLVTFSGRELGTAGGWVIWNTTAGLLRVDAPAWSDTSVRALVPDNVATGDVFLRRRNGRQTNGLLWMRR